MSSTPALIPQPRQATFTDGEFSLNPDIVIACASKASAEAEYLADALASQTGRHPTVVQEDVSHSLLLVVDETQGSWGQEDYRLSVTENQVRIVAATSTGVFYGIQTLLQLVCGSMIPCCAIEDSPKLRWRGLMLDVARHFMPVAFITKLIDVMALHKLNRLHLHLTDDQGWRLEIEAFPDLAPISSVRSETLVGHHQQEGSPRRFDGKPHGGYYRKQEIRDLVAYAASRHITIVPEIEMPGHCQAVLASFPAMSCKGGRFEVRRQWGGDKDVYCAGNDDVFTFLETVLDETLQLFPSEFIHIGGDECPKDRWKTCPKCQKRIKDEGLADEYELQSWFIRRIERFLSSRGRRLVGWDEILEGGLPSGATVMSWRGEAGGIAAAKSGHDVVMTPVSHTYFDYYQGDPKTEPLAIGGFLPLRKAYEYQPIPDVLTQEERRRILGTQAQLWTEYMPSPEHVEYMAFPRACALAEVAWGTSDAANYDGFLTRLSAHLNRLKALGVNYRPLA
ncbi:MAG: beta-N-acetylhexosaminidase [Capsulimonadaceae bacterium]|nr:beta-N-acetylhexosaminidase [Capsulimonadaceae bacterium]